MRRQPTTHTNKHTHIYFPHTGDVITAEGESQTSDYSRKLRCVTLVFSASFTVRSDSGVLCVNGPHGGKKGGEREHDIIGKREGGREDDLQIKPRTNL